MFGKREKRFAGTHFRRRAFTLVEIVVVIALIALVSGIAVWRFDLLVPAIKTPSPEKTVIRACALAAHCANTQKKRYFLKTDAENSCIRLETADGKTIETFVLPDSEKGIRIRFRPDSRESVRTFLPPREEIIEALEFHPAGCSTPAFIEIVKSGKTIKRFRLDPFSGGPTEETLP